MILQAWLTLPSCFASSSRPTLARMIFCSVVMMSSNAPRRGASSPRPLRAPPRLRFAVGIGHRCQIKFWLMQISVLNIELGSKQLELLHEMVPAATSIALLINPASPAFAEPLVRQLKLASEKRKLRLHVLQASAERDFDSIFATLAKLRAGALVISSDPFLNSRSELLATLALRHKVPTMHQIREFPAAG